MIRTVERSRRRALLRLAPLTAILLTAGAAADRLPSPLLINETPSLPRGLYLRQADAPPARGDVVAASQPEHARPYLAVLGVPEDLPLIKRVGAVPGDHICADGRHLILPFRTVPVGGYDRSGRPLPVWTGCRTLAPGEVLLLGDSATSFDGRYFGPVTRDQLLGRYRIVLTW